MLKIGVAVSVVVATTTSASLQCELYIAPSTIPNAGLGVFSGVAKSKGETIGNGDVAIPLIDLYWHNGQWYDPDDDDDDDDDYQEFFNPLSNYVWVSTTKTKALLSVVCQASTSVLNEF
jgi:hypothetical protein